MGYAEKQVVIGTHREVPVETTLERLRPLLERFEITRVANITGLDDVGIPTVVVTRPTARSLSVSQGKGLSLAAAKVSGIMESIEQWHAEHVDLPVFLGSYRERARRERVVDAAALPRYVRQWDPDASVLWTEATSLRDGDKLEVPFELVHLNMTLPLPTGSGFFPLTSNGLASGNSLAEAIVHGACELIERDAVALFYQLSPERQAARRVSLASVEDQSCKELLERFQRAGVAVGIWDATSDVGIATFLCSVIERELDPFRQVGLARGFGCHPDRAVALARALCEAAQSRLTRIAGSRDDIQAEDVDLLRERGAMRLQQLQLTAEGAGPRALDEVASRQFRHVHEDLAWIQRCLADIGLDQLLYVELTRPELEIAVVRVVVPGLEGSADVPGYVPGARARAIQQANR